MGFIQITKTQELAAEQHGMFAGCLALKEVRSLAPDASATHTVSFAKEGDALAKLNSCFESCASSGEDTGLENISGLAKWDISAVDSLRLCFSNCNFLKDLSPIANWDVSHVTNFDCMLNWTAIENVDALSNWKLCTDPTADISFFSTFSACLYLSDISGLAQWNVSRVWKLNETFYYTAITSLDALAKWNVSHVGENLTDPAMNSTFAYCEKLVNSDGISHWNIASAAAQEGGLDQIFAGCSALRSLVVSDTGNGFFLISAEDRPGSSMWLPETDEDGNTLYWWPVKLAATDPSTVTPVVTYDEGINDLYTRSKETGTYGTRWYATTSNTENPVLQPSSISASWQQTQFSYTGYNQVPLPIVTATLNDADTELTQGQDYAISYTKDGKSYAAISEPGMYSVVITPQGKYYYTSAIQSQNIEIVPIVTFDTQGGSPVPDTQSVEPGSHIEEPQAPQKEGYSFTGWYKDSAATEQWNFATDVMPEANLTLYAGWKANASHTGWVWEETAWRYYTEDGSYLADGWQWVADDVYGAHWYYFYADGFCAMRDWIWDNAWYYIQGDCAMACGRWNWIDGAWYGFNWDGAMCVGWIWDNSYVGWYYCYSNGIMARNTWVDSYWVDDTGRWIS